MKSVKRATRACGHETALDASGAGVVCGCGGCQRRRCIGKRDTDSVVFPCSHESSVACVPCDARTGCVEIQTVVALQAHSR